MIWNSTKCLFATILWGCRKTFIIFIKYENAYYKMPFNIIEDNFGGALLMNVVIMLWDDYYIK